MPVASASARTQPTLYGLFSQRYGSFAGKAAAAPAVHPLVRFESRISQRVSGQSAISAMLELESAVDASLALLSYYTEET